MERAYKGILAEERDITSDHIIFNDQQPAKRSALEEALLPPINSQSIRSINLGALIKTLSVRHDIVLDEDSRVKARTSADSDKSQDYWLLVQLELEDILGSEACHGHSLKNTRLFAVLREIKEMLKAIYPASKKLHEFMENSFDLEYLESIILQREFDIVVWFSEIAEIVKQSCAPRRDVLLDELVVLAEQGKYVQALKAFLEINNLMHLDLVNSQLTRQRETFALTLAAEEKEHFMEQFRTFQLYPNHLKQLMRDIVGVEGDGISVNQLYLRMFLSLVDGCSNIPETFKFDHWRLKLFHIDLQNIAIMSCMNIWLRFLMLPALPRPEAIAKWKARLHQIVGQKSSTIEDLCEELKFEVSAGRLLVNMEKIDDELLFAIVDKTLAPEHKVFQLVYYDALSYIEGYLATGQVKDDQWLARHGLEMVSLELNRLTLKLHRLYVHNWMVFKDFYGETYDEIRA